jgi:hypothetical protein
MPGYPPESPWNDYPTEEQQASIRRACHILNKECQIPDTKWQARDMQKELWDKVEAKGLPIPEVKEPEFHLCACEEYGPPPEITKAQAKIILQAIEEVYLTQPNRMFKIDLERVFKFKLEQFHRGMQHELEHGCRSPLTNVTCDNLAATGKIALAHLLEDPNYYEKLDRAEQSDG